MFTEFSENMVSPWRGPASPTVASSIPGQGTCLGCGLSPGLGVCERQQIETMSFSLPFPLSKNK